ncbi:MAG: NAD-dependent protein deacylase [Bacteroides sp.]|nr:NAD-dependent protein deacylase [Prevotella sp.]MCM1408010.1 NAD-dependent protein deacylase [Treponema brennaborense]MCM1468986.1 NAD-dependent protein deacylase [Bacteroides sp.]
MTEIEHLQDIIDKSQRIVFFGGAGVSTESGIPDFRSTGGLYRQQWKYPPETILSHSFFMAETAEFFRFYREKMLVLNAEPNAAHCKLAELEKSGKLTAVITQNIDGLHQKAGSKTVHELHGSIHRNYCIKCGAFYNAEALIKLCAAEKDGIPRCENEHCRGVIKPDVVLYEESLNSETMSLASKALGAADTLIIGGTSLAVYPAAGMIYHFHGNNIVLLNKSETPHDGAANLVVHDSIGKILAQIHV